MPLCHDQMYFSKKNSYVLENPFGLGEPLHLGIFTKKILVQSATEKFLISKIHDLVKEKKAFPQWWNDLRQMEQNRLKIKNNRFKESILFFSPSSSP